MNKLPSHLFESIEAVVARDPGRRGIRGLVQWGTVQTAARSLLEAGPVVITTGFCVVGLRRCETDGPPGAFALGRALASLGKDVTYLADRQCGATLEHAGLRPLVRYDEDGLGGVEPTHLVAVERPGRSVDGRYYDMRGHDISPWTPDVDQAFLDLPSRGVVTLGIGDGGNEIGMGKVHAAVVGSVRNGNRIGTVVSTEHLIVAGVSNWGAWGLVAALSLLAGRDLLPTAKDAREQLASLVAAGAVDGVSGRAQCTVDGLPWVRHRRVLADLRRLVRVGLGHAQDNPRE